MEECCVDTGISCPVFTTCFQGCRSKRKGSPLASTVPGAIINTVVAKASVLMGVGLGALGAFTIPFTITLILYAFLSLFIIKETPGDRWLY